MIEKTIKNNTRLLKEKKCMLQFLNIKKVKRSFRIEYTQLHTLSDYMKLHPETIKDEDLLFFINLEIWLRFLSLMNFETKLEKITDYYSFPIGDIMNSKYTYFRTLTFKQQKEDDQLYQQLKQKGISTVEALKQVNDNRLGVVL